MVSSRVKRTIRDNRPIVSAAIAVLSPVGRWESMAIYESFSKRLKKREKAGERDVYQYEVLPKAFLNQVIYIWLSAIGNWQQMSWGSLTTEPVTNEWWRDIHNILARDKGT